MRGKRFLTGPASTVAAFLLSGFFLLIPEGRKMEGRTAFPLGETRGSKATSQARGAVGFGVDSETADRLQTLHRDFRTTIRQAMQEAAVGAGISMQSRASDEPIEGIEVFVKKEPSGTTWRHKTRLALISFPLPVADNLSVQQMEKGVDLLFTFLLLPDGSDLPSGFYIVSFSRNPRNGDAWTARFRNLNGRVVLQKPATGMETLGPRAAKEAATATVRFDRKHPPREGNAYVCQVGHFSPLQVVTSFEASEGEVRSVSRPASAARIVRAIEAYAAAVGDLLEEASASYGKRGGEEWLSLSMGDAGFAVVTVFADAERYRLEDVAKGRDILFG